MRLVLSISLVSALALAACSKKEEPAAEPEAKPATGEVKTEEAKPTEGVANPSGSVGVAECDDYIAKMSACVEKLPEAQKAATLQSFEASKKAWTEQAANPEAKAQLATACKTAIDSAKQNLASLGCTF